MRKFILMGLLTATTSFLLIISCGTTENAASAPVPGIDKVINVKEVERIEKTLASDAMRGRRAFTPDIDRAAEFIAAEFKSIGLQIWNNNNNYRQEFAMVRTKNIATSGNFDGTVIDEKNIIVITSQSHLKINQSSGYEKVSIKAGTNLQIEARKMVRSNKNLLVLVDKSFSNSFGNISRLKSSMFKAYTNVVFVLSDTDPARFDIESTHEITEQKLANIVAVLPGKSKKDEYVIFSGHYDHLGVGKPVNGDSIYNGANDDAAGITALIMLSNYFKQVNNNERTIVFAAFTAEEVGGFGSQYFSRQIDADKVMAMFNIEMIGTESKWGKNSAYITGYEKTNMGEILAKDLKGTAFAFYPDPYPQQQLFYRSDNATLARLGVPAHTISTSKMDVEPHYHKLTDHVETLDLTNMTEVIKAITLSSKSIIAGKETPTRVKVDELR
ncbi:MAG TPA: M20/M25/M40 family metallo-hydrolase [Chitinophagaceae bacterium]|nr:M20/M25/M40 family metallo-hydrolase [Chitinophagaceae bacterium]